MAPSKSSEDRDYKFLMSVLKSCENIKPDWDLVAQENGIAYGKNASSRFSSFLKKNGYKLEKGKIIGVEDDDAAAPTTTASQAPKTPKMVRKTAEGKAGNVSARKRSASEMEDQKVEADAEGKDEAGEASPANEG